MKLGRVSFV